MREHVEAESTLDRAEKRNQGGTCEIGCGHGTSY